MKIENNKRAIANSTLSLKEIEQIIIEFSNSIFTKESELELFRDLAQNLIKHLNFEDCAIYMIDEKSSKSTLKKALKPMYSKNQSNNSSTQMSIVSETVFTELPSRKTERSNYTSVYASSNFDTQSKLSEITTPIIIDNHEIGTITCVHSQSNFFTHQHLHLLTIITLICANKIKYLRAENKRQWEQNQLANLKASALKANLSSHFVFNAINAIQYFITTNDKDSGIRYLSIFSKLIRYHLNNYEADKVHLKEEIAMLDGYLKLQQLRYQDQFDYDIIHQLSESDQQIKIPSIVLSSLIENAVEESIFRGQAKTSFNNHLTLNIELNDNLDIHLSYRLNKGENKAAYRNDLMPWEEQIKLLNQIKGYKIKFKTSVTENIEDHSNTINISLFIPI